MSLTAVIETNKGTINIELFADQTPITCANFVNLIQKGYYDGLSFHRVISDFMIQGGCPLGTGTGGPGYSITDELPSAGEYKLGSLAMANSGPNTNGSQFFIISGEQGIALPPSYSLFGQVTTGLDTTLPALDKAGNSDPASNGLPPKEEIRIISVTVSES